MSGPLDVLFAQVRLNTNLVRDAIGFALAEKNIPHEPQWTLLAPQNLDNIDAALSSIERHVQDMDALVLDMGEHIHAYGFGAESDALLSRLSRLGAGDSNQNEKEASR